MNNSAKQSLKLIFLSLALAFPVLFFRYHIPFARDIHWDLFDRMQKIDMKFRDPPSLIKDILLVLIDNDTLKNIKQRWPYPRSYFAKAIDNLHNAGAKVIAFDFLFHGDSSPEEDALLKNSLENKDNIILASSINEDGTVDFQTNGQLASNSISGIITKLQEKNGLTRRNLTYLVSRDEPSRGFLSWEMKILQAVKNIDLETLAIKETFISFHNGNGEEWTVPVSKTTKSFLIHFRANSAEFPKLSFYKALNNEFDPAIVENKIVLVGSASSLLQDIHYTPIGWLPGITLNANGFLTLYSHDFLKKIPKYSEACLLILGIILSAFFVSLNKSLPITLAAIGMEIAVFFTLAYVLFTLGYLVNYFLFPFVTLFCPFLSKKIIKSLALKVNV